jgi:hypothetical protein
MQCTVICRTFQVTLRAEARLKSEETKAAFVAFMERKKA